MQSVKIFWKILEQNLQVRNTQWWTKKKIETIEERELVSNWENIREKESYEYLGCYQVNKNERRSKKGVSQKNKETK